jgi:hypothetical protein
MLDDIVEGEKRILGVGQVDKEKVRIRLMMLFQNNMPLYRGSGSTPQLCDQIKEQFNPACYANHLEAPEEAETHQAPYPHRATQLYTKFNILE